MLKGLRKKANVLSLGAFSDGEEIHSATEKYTLVLKQVTDFELALKAMDYLLDDRTTEGTTLLKLQTPSFTQPSGIFPLALGVMNFIEATLGFEPDVMENAHKTLMEAESASLQNSKFNTKHKLSTSHIYPPGTEFQVTYAESTLLCALLMLLKENNGMVEGAKALFKLRTAYKTLDQIYKKINESEPVFNKNINILKKQSLSNYKNLSNSDLPGFNVPNSSTNSSTSSLQSTTSDLKLIENLEKVYLLRKSRINGSNLKDSDDLFAGLSSSTSDLNNDLSSEVQNKLNLEDESNYTTPSPPSLISTSSSVDDNHQYVSTIDEFIHSGVQFCFGILQVVLSLIPPTIGKVLSIVGFKGDRETGLKLLWKTAITSRNIHGALALLCLLVFYDGPVQFIDVGFQLPDHEDSKIKDIISLAGKVTVSDDELNKILRNPALYTPQLLNSARECFPHNALWLLQESRILAAQGHLYKAVDMMQAFTDDKKNVINMRQVEALLIFDRAMFYAFTHNFDKAARDLIYLIDINSWSKGVYLFMAANCYLEHYRLIKMGLVKVDNIDAELEKYEKLAVKYFELAPTYVPGHGHNAIKKKGGIGGSSKKMPFDNFLLRKMNHIEQRQKKNPKLSFIDCVGTSIIHEMMYFWNGYNRMQPSELEQSLKLLGYSGGIYSELSANTDQVNYSRFSETKDEAMIRYFLQGIILRSLGKVQEGLDLIDNHIISEFTISEHPYKFHPLVYSPYLYPTVLYEKTMFTWISRTRESTKFDVDQVVTECKSWLKKAEMLGEGDYELSNRTGMRIKAAGDRLEQLRK